MNEMIDKKMIEDIEKSKKEPNKELKKSTDNFENYYKKFKVN